MPCTQPRPHAGLVTLPQAEYQDISHEYDVRSKLSEVEQLTAQARHEEGPSGRCVPGMFARMQHLHGSMARVTVCCHGLTA